MQTLAALNAQIDAQQQRLLLARAIAEVALDARRQAHDTPGNVAVTLTASLINIRCLRKMNELEIEVRS